MNRRGCLRALGLAAVGLTLDPERLLWVPGAKTILLPPVTRSQNLGEIVAIAWESHVKTARWEYIPNTYGLRDAQVDAA